jgi:nicotinic acid mononucleotide adenylyltransferase
MFFFDKLNKSPWKGHIVEVGAGIPFTQALTLTSGASETLLGMECPYGRADAGTGIVTKRVSQHYVGSAARAALKKGDSFLGQHDYNQHLFGLAISAAHYGTESNRTSHAWVAIATQEDTSYLHFSAGDFPGYKDRETFSKLVCDTVIWFMSQVLLHEYQSWIDAIKICNITSGVYIDVLYAPGVSDIERLLLLDENNPLAYKDGQFRRVVDILRQHDTIYPGSFNPVHKAHLNNGKGALFELSQKNCYKGDISLEDLLHRIRMLDLCGVPILITRSPLFLQKHALVSKVSPPRNGYKYVIGADAWNAFVNPLQYAQDGQELEEFFENAIFKVFARPKVEVVENQVTKHLNYKIALDAGEPSEYSSTEIRKGNLEGVAPKVAKYIRDHNLYEFTES